MVGNGHAIDVGFGDGGVITEDGRDFGGGDVFRLPTEGVAETVEEEPAAVCVTAECVWECVSSANLLFEVKRIVIRGGWRIKRTAGLVVEVAFLEDVARKAFIGCFLVLPVACENCWIVYFYNDFAAL